MQDRPVSELMKEIVSSFSSLIRAEVRLAKAEVTSSARDVSQDIIRGVIFGVIALLGVLALMSFLIIGLGELLGDRYWLSSLIVTVLFLGAGGIAALMYLKRVPDDAKVTHIQRNLEDDRDLITQKVRDIATAPRSGDSYRTGTGGRP